MNPFAPDVSNLLRRLLRTRSSIVADYPDPSAATAALAAAIGVDSDRLVLTNGGAEAIALTAAVVRIGSIVEPEFSLYRRHLDSVESGAPRWRANPSNPLGRLAPAADTAGVWDEAFYPLATGRWTRGDIGSWRLGSLTKLWHCPGLRLGYVIAPSGAAAAQIRRCQPRWSVNGLVAAAVPELLAATDLTGWAAGIAELRADFTRALTTLGYTAEPTDSNWVLVADQSLRDRLAPLGVVVRDCTSFGIPGLARVAIPRPAQLDRVITCFAQVAGR
jgi:threonine-phosphate decarboxylase